MYVSSYIHNKYTQYKHILCKQKLLVLDAINHDESFDSTILYLIFLVYAKLPRVSASRDVLKRAVCIVYLPVEQREINKNHVPDIFTAAFGSNDL